jgi:two-component system, repressor protein LuxO
VTAQSHPLVLLVEDTEPLAGLYIAYMMKEPVRVRHVATLEAARDALLTLRPAALLLDLELPDGNGLELIATARAAGIDPAVIVITAHGSVNAAVEAMRAGAHDFLVKPFNADRLRTTLRNALERRRLASIVETLGTEINRPSFEGFIGGDLSMHAVYRVIELAAKSRSTVFITGESGTGKEVCAEAIHRRSPRKNGAFVALNCGAVPKELMESEIFGHVKGAFTGATSDRDGAALRADGGTLFLDELCEMDPALQVKLLRFVQTGAVQPVGCDSTRKVDVRIICATNRDPLAEMEAGRFREDLYYRLHVVPIQMPPLRERGGDVLLLARHFLESFSREESRSFRGFAADAEARLCAAAWPGNVRHLQNVIRQVVVVHDRELVTADMLPPEIDAERAPESERVVVAAAATESPARPSGPTQEEILPLAVVERQTIERAIAICGGNMTEAAARLGVNVSTIYRKRLSWAGKAAE